MLKPPLCPECGWVLIDYCVQPELIFLCPRCKSIIEGSDEDYGHA